VLFGFGFGRLAFFFPSFFPVSFLFIFFIVMVFMNEGKEIFYGGNLDGELSDIIAYSGKKLRFLRW
jgi:hypothetical protein